MAGIDKIYISDINDRNVFLNWCKDNNDKCIQDIDRSLLNYFYYINENEDFFKDWIKEQGEIPITNFPSEVDHWLIKNCNIEFVINRLKGQYEDSFDEMLNSPFKPIKYLYKKDELASKYKLINKNKGYNFGVKNKHKYHVSLKGKPNDWWWFYDDKYPVNTHIETGPNHCYISSSLRKYKSLKAILRNIRKWNLPKGLVIEISGYYIGENWEIHTK